MFGASEAATHSLSLLFGLLCIPAGTWAAWSLFGRRAGLYAAVLFAFSTFLTAYAQETRMYELMALLGILETAAFIHGFVYRRRRYLIMFAICQALMLYTHGWGIFFGVGTVLALIPVWRASDDRRGLVRDAVLTYVGAGILFLPWLPNFIYQATHTGAPWAPTIRFGVPVLLSQGSARQRPPHGGAAASRSSSGSPRSSPSAAGAPARGPSCGRSSSCCSGR